VIPHFFGQLLCKKVELIDVLVGISSEGLIQQLDSQKQTEEDAYAWVSVRMQFM
jgi:hypothetical protein